MSALVQNTKTVVSNSSPSNGQPGEDAPLTASSGTILPTPRPPTTAGGQSRHGSDAAGAKMVADGSQRPGSDGRGPEVGNRQSEQATTNHSIQSRTTEVAI